MSFRPATPVDTALLFAWRRQAEHASWYQGKRIRAKDHCEWLQARLDNPLVKVLVWQEDGPVGMVRIDSNGELAFHCADNQACVRMLQAAREYAADYGGRLKAAVDSEDVRSWEMLARAGFVEYPARFLVYK